MPVIYCFCVLCFWGCGCFCGFVGFCWVLFVVCGCFGLLDGFVGLWWCWGLFFVVVGFVGLFCAICISTICMSDLLSPDKEHDMSKYNLDKEIEKAFPKSKQKKLDDLITQLKQMHVLSDDEIEHDEFIGNIVSLLQDIHPALTMPAMIQHWYEDAGLNAHISQIEAVDDDTIADW
jgi:hypothetical protein